jgi:hypothetical protein
LLADIFGEESYAFGFNVGEISEHLFCGLEDRVVLITSLTMIMFHGEPLMRRVTEIIDRVVEAVLNYYLER